MDVPLPNKELEEALNAFETKAQEESLTKEQKAEPQARVIETQRIVKWVMNSFNLKEEKQADYVILGFFIIAMIISYFLFFGFPEKKKDIPPDIQVPGTTRRLSS